jgi:hypothetical protein
MSRIRMHLGVVLVGIGIAGLHLAAHATSVPFWGAHASVSIDTPIEQLRPGEFIWMGDAVSSGPMVMVVSISEQRAYVYRNGIEIGRARLVVLSDKPIPSHALVLVEGRSSVADPYVPDPAKLRWMRIGVPGHMSESGTEVDAQAIGKIQIPAEFVSHVNSILEPGATVLITDEPLSSQTNGAALQIADADSPNTSHRS